MPLNPPLQLRAATPVGSRPAPAEYGRDAQETVYALDEEVLWMRLTLEERELTREQAAPVLGLRVEQMDGLDRGSLVMSHEDWMRAIAALEEYRDG